MPTKYKFPCGCEIDQLDDKIKEQDGLPSLHIDYSKLREDCPLAWQIFAEGKTIGVFQLEKSLGQNWSKRLKPVDIEELAALVSLLRPGCLKSFIDGKSMTQHYVDRKHGVEPLQIIDQSIEEILKPTQGVLVFQEQSMAIATAIAGFNLQQADNLRKAIGKKKADLMAKVKSEFIDGIEKTGIVSKEKGNEIFSAIEKSNRYAFNKCLAPSTIVETINGLKTLEEIKIGDYIKAPKNNNEDEFVEVLDKVDNGEQELYEITLESGKTIQCTLNHKFLCENGEILPLIEILEKKYKIMCECDILSNPEEIKCKLKQLLE